MTNNISYDSRRDWPVFIVGSYRSGSTLLRVLLNEHDRLACPPESKFLSGLAEVLSFPEAYRALMGMGLTKQRFMQHMGQFVNNLFSEIASAQGKARWVEKTPNYYKLVPFIDDLFDDRVLYIILVRHPLDCVASLEEFMTQFKHHEDRDIADHIASYGADRYAWAKLWCRIYERVYFFTRSRLDRSIQVSYEHLVTETEGTIKAILGFIGETYSPVILERALKGQPPSGLGDPKIRRTRSVHQDSLGRWREWPRAETEALWQLVEPTARLLGYGTLDSVYPILDHELGR